ncbi:unnamed protein product [Periconia digitata]|uniref:Cell division cycle protein 123 n=1 Tax=Periconia digitata TaxID=1303443 RepID=A0A9W4UL21_9PLEO|nr:unnamed protein product [Periconia digitata]
MCEPNMDSSPNPILLRVIPHSEVIADHEAVRTRQDTDAYSRSQRFNTADHTRDEILPIVPEPPNFTHSPPDWKLYSYILWQPLIAKSQHLTSSESVVSKLPNFLWDDLMRCYGAWLSGGKLSDALLEDVVEMWTSHPSGKELKRLFDGQKKWFVRLAQMSPKDSPLEGAQPSFTLRDVVAKVCSSMRAHGCLQREKEDAAKEHREMEIYIVVNKWDDDMDPAREFRVFVPPVLAANQQTTPPFPQGPTIHSQEPTISGISQYAWHRPFQQVLPNSTTLAATAENIHSHAREILNDMVDYARDNFTDDVSYMLLRYGLTFDICVKDTGDGVEVQLLEINPFGAMSVCGACLFHWIRDGRVLYGLEPAQFLVTTDP